MRARGRIVGLEAHMSLSTFGVFLLVGSDSAVKVRGGCQEARHRDWIQCFRGDIHGSISFK